MAQVYAEKLFCNPKTKKPYYFGTILNEKQPVGDVIFNATDFRSGIAFRFQRSEDSDALIGNFYNNIDKADATKIRIADIVAASSCFPGGFEPISFPYDFSWDDVEIPAKVQQAFPFKRSDDDSANPKGPLALMDGGVFDNQGLQSLLTVEERSGNNFDLLVISDVDQPSVDLYEMPKPGSNTGLSLNTIVKLAKTFMILSAVSVVYISICAWQDISSGQIAWVKFVFLYLIPFLLSSAAASSLWYLNSVIRDDVLPQIPLVGELARKSLKRLTIGQMRNMLKLRVTSLLTLTSSIFMKRIRSLVYGMAYGKNKTPYEGKRVSNLIYSLAPSKTKVEPVKGIGKPSDWLNQVACVAFNQKTTLWFDKEYQQPCLIASGQASMCYNMIKLFSRRYGSDPSKYTPTVNVMWEKIKEDWSAFNHDPFFMLKKEEVEKNWKEIKQSVERVKCDWGMFTKEEISASHNTDIGAA